MKKINFNRELQYEPDWIDETDDYVSDDHVVRVRRCVEDSGTPTPTPKVSGKEFTIANPELLGEHKGFLYGLLSGISVRRTKRKS